MKLFVILIAFSGFAHAEVSNTDFCKKMYNTKISKKDFVLTEIYDSDTLCGYVMNGISKKAMLLAPVEA